MELDTPLGEVFLLNGMSCRQRIGWEGLSGTVKNRDVFLGASMDGFTAFPERPSQPSLC
jgi:hypothetical protein